MTNINLVMTKINERIAHIKTLGNGYGKNEARIRELQFVLKLLKMKGIENEN